jgi:hypothetical protein
MQKVLRVIDDHTESLDTYLNNGWTVKQMTACMCKRTLNDSVCYVLIEI